jgi:transcriptional regulator GlxA family with amidase domain
MRTKARRVVLVAFDEVELLDLTAPLEVLSIAGRRWNFRPYKVEIVAERPGLIVTRNQLRVEASAALASAGPAEIVIVPGGYGARRFAEDPDCLSHLSRVASGAEILAGLGAGVAVLARAGLLGQARIAASAELDALLEGLVEPSARDFSAKIVESERVISVRASGAAIDLGVAIVRRTMGPKLATMVMNELGLENDDANARLELNY